jgi:hypothetical protein
MLLAAVWLAGVIPALAGPNSPTRPQADAHQYPSGATMAAKLGTDLYETLDEKFQKSLLPEPVAVEAMDAPIITPTAASDGKRTLGRVAVSAGFIDLINHIAHAKAIDRIQPGYFERYVLNLGRESANDALPDLPGMVDPRYWKDDVMNDQLTYFNQMIGMALAINLAHHYLGHFNQCAGQMLGGKLVPINNLLAPAEWDAGVKAATLNCLNAALATTGPKALFEAIDKMPRRPAWTNFIVPPNADLKKLASQLSTYEVAYFRGGLK